MKKLILFVFICLFLVGCSSISEEDIIFELQMMEGYIMSMDELYFDDSGMENNLLISKYEEALNEVKEIALEYNDLTVSKEPEELLDQYMLVVEMLDATEHSLQLHLDYLQTGNLDSFERELDYIKDYKEKRDAFYKGVIMIQKKFIE